MRISRWSAVLAVAALLGTACDGAIVSDDGDESPDPAPTVTVTVTETETAASDGGTDDGAAGDPCGDLGGEQAQVTDLSVLFVTAPTVGAAVTSGFEVRGCTNAFEAAFQWELVTNDGEVLASDVGTASCGTGCLGTFSFTVDHQVDAETVATLRVFTESAEDGSTRDVNAIPVRLQP